MQIWWVDDDDVYQDDVGTGVAGRTGHTKTNRGELDLITLRPPRPATYRLKRVALQALKSAKGDKYRAASNSSSTAVSGT